MASRFSAPSFWWSLARALYADMDISASVPFAWPGSAWSCLRCCSIYFGQGALLITTPTAVHQPFFLLAPQWALFPLVAWRRRPRSSHPRRSFPAPSPDRQAIQLGYSPRLDIAHNVVTRNRASVCAAGQLGADVCTILIVIGFGSSTALAAAYGIAVTLTMVITAVLLHVVATERWHWPRPVAFMVTGVFLSIDLAFFGANVLKIFHGGWLPSSSGPCSSR